MTAVAEQLRSFVAGASLEVTPRDAERAAALLPAGMTVYVTALPGADPDDLVDAAVRLRAGGQVPVPHIAARGIASAYELDRLLGRLAAEAGVDDVLVVAGSVKRPAGVYPSSMAVLSSGLLEQHGIRRVAVAGHPEGSPDIGEAAEADAIAWKNAFGERSSLELRIVTQFALAAQPYVDWEERIRAAGNRLPVTAGVPGVTSPPQLLKFGLRCGIGPSLEILRKQSGGLVRLATTRLWRPDELVEQLAAAQLADPQRLFDGIHLFPFGGVERTAEWLSSKRGAAGALAGG
jgi:methylenetetrahydrofolate reductase (NADPH)